MSSVRLIADLNEMIIEKYITDYPTFRRFLLTVVDRDERIGYIRKYMRNFATDKYLESLRSSYNKDERVLIRTLCGIFGSYKKEIIVLDDLTNIPFYEGITNILITYEMKTLITLSHYSDIKCVNIREHLNVSPEDFVRAFPKLRKLECYEIDFIDRVLAISTTIEEVIFYRFHGINTTIPLKYPRVKFIIKFENIGYLEKSGILGLPNIKNISCSLWSDYTEIQHFNPMSAKIESLRISVSSSTYSPIIIPNHFKYLRFLTIVLCYEQPAGDIIIDGFPVLEYIEILANNNGAATCKIANVPYIFCLTIIGSVNPDIDYETVSILDIGQNPFNPRI
jgi:hypothetical protein